MLPDDLEYLMNHEANDGVNRTGVYGYNSQDSARDLNYMLRQWVLHQHALYISEEWEEKSKVEKLLQTVETQDQKLTRQE
jgi:hypothetical protein